MIFGFNTDARCGETVYHVQSEAREADLLIQTQVFVSGRCVGKHATSYAAKAAQPGFSEQQIHELLKAQHRCVLEAAREGRLDSLLSASAKVQDAGTPGLALEWLSSAPANSDGSLMMRFVVTRAGTPVQGAVLRSRLALSQAAPIHSETITGADGMAEIKIKFPNPAAHDAAVMVQATHGEWSATRKFRVKKTSN